MEMCVQSISPITFGNMYPANCALMAAWSTALYGNLPGWHIDDSRPHSSHGWTEGRLARHWPACQLFIWRPLPPLRSDLSYLCSLSFSLLYLWLCFVFQMFCLFLDQYNIANVAIYVSDSHLDFRSHNILVSWCKRWSLRSRGLFIHSALFCAQVLAPLYISRYKLE